MILEFDKGFDQIGYECLMILLMNLINPGADRLKTAHIKSTSNEANASRGCPVTDLL